VLVAVYLPARLQWRAVFTEQLLLGLMRYTRTTKGIEQNMPRRIFLSMLQDVQPRSQHVQEHEQDRNQGAVQAVHQSY